MRETKLQLDLSLLNIQFKEQDALEPVYTMAFRGRKKNRNRFVVKVRNIYGIKRRLR